MHGHISRRIHRRVVEGLRDFPAVALLGPRQCGKTTLARAIVGEEAAAAYLDLERPSDLRKLSEPELFFALQRERGGTELFCLDEVQRVPELFPVLRSVIDEGNRNGQFLILGSASRELLRQTSETLAGRILYLELTPFLVAELGAERPADLARLWLRGGFPRSFLARADDSSYEWRGSFVRTFLERDLPQLGFNIPAEMLHRLWRMLAHVHGQVFNGSKLGGALGVSHTTIQTYLDLLAQTFMVRRLEPLEANVKKRLIKSPKVYVRDSGILHALLEIESESDLLGHPSAGESWEGFVIENVIASMPGWSPSFYRTSNGAEIDLVLERGRRRIAIECKLSKAPDPTRGFWTSLEDLAPDEAWIIAPVEEPYPLRAGVMVAPLAAFLARQDLPARTSNIPPPPRV